MYPVNAHTQRHVGTIIHHRQKLISALEYADQLQLERSGTYRERKIAVGQYVPLQPLTNSYTPIPYINVYTGESYTGQLYPLGRFNELAPLIMTTIEGILQPISANVIDKEVLVIRPPTYGDLHSYLKTHKRLPEQLSSSYFKQVMHIINQVHSRGIILRDLKLKKFHFTDPNLTTLALSDLEDAIYLEDWSDDHLSKRHGCPAYIAPEMLQPGSYSGRASDIWSAGIILYTLLVGHYPFFDTDPQVLFTKIRAGYYHLPPTISYIARHLISSLLAYDPSERPSADAIASHPWLIRPPSTMTNEEIVASLKHASDQIVPIHKMID